jgi:hypothetical protein
MMLLDGDLAQEVLKSDGQTHALYRHEDATGGCPTPVHDASVVKAHQACGMTNAEASADATLRLETAMDASLLPESLRNLADIKAVTRVTLTDHRDDKTQQANLFTLHLREGHLLGSHLEGDGLLPSLQIGPVSVRRNVHLIAQDPEVFKNDACPFAYLVLSRALGTAN